MWEKIKPAVTKYGPWLAFCVAGYLIAQYTGVPFVPPPPPQKPAPEQPGTLVEASGDYTPTFGWVPPSPDQLAANLDPVATTQFDATPAGKVALGDDEVFLWQAVRKVNNRGPPWYPNVNQQSVGCCVGCGWKHAADVCAAVQIIQGGRAEEWKPLAVEAIYGASRVEIGGGRLSGDGSIGSWAKAAVERIGNLAMQAYPAANVDLTVFSPARARQWGQSGVPAALEPLAGQHTIKGCALVKTATDAQRAIGQGYPVAVCSNQGFTMSRDKDGFARPQGTWAHCMAIIGHRGGTRPGFFILNSWGDAAHTGGVYPEDMPVAGFWAEPDVVDRMLRQGDSFALSDLVGFPVRKLDPADWTVKADAAKTDYALAP